MLALRDYQERAVSMLRDAHRDRPLACLPTGAGKTVIASHIIARFKGRVLFLVHRRELALQAQRRLLDHGVPSGLILGGEPVDPAQRVQIASIQTLARRDLPPAELLIIDEAHHAIADSWRELIDRYPDAIVIGMTATPFRLDKRGLGRIFGKIIVPTTVRELVANGVLIEPKVYCAPPPDLKGVRKVAGEYHEGQLGERMCKLVGNVVEQWGKRAEGKRTVAFAVNVEHSKAICTEFLNAGIRAAHIDGSMPDRDGVLADLADGRIDVLSNCMILGEGWDLPSLECAILARPTLSLTVHLQQVGRIMRACPGKDGAIVLDHAGNHHMHGLVTDEIDYELTDKARAAAPPRDFKTCPACWVICGISERVCPECGHVFSVAVEVPEHADGELEEFSPEDRRAAYRDLVLTASTRGYKLGWARVQFKDRFHVWPRKMGDIDALYQCPEHTWEVRQYGTVCARCLRKKT